MTTVLQVSQRNYLDGGSDRMFFETVRLLEAHGHRVIPFAAADERNRATPWERYFPEAADFERPGARDLWRFLYSRPARQALETLLREHPVDIAHLHIYYGKLTSSILAPLKRAGIPVVQTLHEYKLICPVYTLVSNGTICEACHGRHFWQALPRRCNRGSLARTTLSVAEAYLSRWLGNVDKVDHFIAISDFQRRKMIEHGVPEHKLSTIHNFVVSADRPPGDGRGGYALFVGRLEALKGVFTLLEAAAELSLPLKIAGRGAAEAELRARIEKRGLGHVELLGFQEGEALAQLIRDSVAMVVPSEWYEPFGLTVIESFAHGRPVVASRIGGITELVDHGRDGFLFEPGNSAQLSGFLKRLSDDPELARRMGRAGLAKATRSFGPERYQRELTALYQTLIERRAARRAGR